MEPYAKMMSSEFHRLPDSVQKAHLSAPLMSVEVEPNNDGFSLVKPQVWNRPAPQALVPKLAVKSWRDAGLLGVIYSGVSISMMLTQLLRNPTSQQKIVARVWFKIGVPLQVHLFPYVDYSEISEARYLALRTSCRRISTCERGASAKLLKAHKDEIDTYAQQIAEELEGDAWIIDLAVTAQGGIGVTEINPAFSPLELNVITL